MHKVRQIRCCDDGCEDCSWAYRTADELVRRQWQRRFCYFDDELALFGVIKAGFSQPRKKVLNALVGGLGAQKERHDRASIAMALANAGIAADRRAETLSIVEWAAVYGALRRDG